jgi:hypothetical protein
MHGPTGCSGVQPFANSLHSKGRIAPLSTSPHWQPGIARGSGGVTSNLRAASHLEKDSRIPSPVPGITPMPRQSASIGSKTSSMSACAVGLPSALTPLR